MSDESAAPKKTSEMTGEEDGAKAIPPLLSREPAAPAAKKTPPKPYVDVVRTTLQILAGTGREGSEQTVRWKELTIPGRPGPACLFPFDDDQPQEEFFSAYVTKEMEYVGCFLLAQRLANEMNQGSMVPKGVQLDDFIEAILYTVGRGIDEKRQTEVLRYYPLPHLQGDLELPFVDFSGFLAVTLSDYLLLASPSESLAKAARAELDTIVEFLTHSDTYIEDQRGVGWGFLRHKDCNTRRMPLGHHRHVLPTAWALVAIQKWVQAFGSTGDKLNRFQPLLPNVLTWLTSLEPDKGLYPGGEIFARNLAAQNYVTEALITLAELKVAEAKPAAIKALYRLIEELDRGEIARKDFELNIAYPVAPGEGKPFMQYPDRTTWATVLATLELGIPLLREPGVHDEAREYLERAKRLCADMIRHILGERRGPHGLWQRDYLQFHWNLTAVEALLRYSRYAETEKFAFSEEALITALDFALQDGAFKQAFREAMRKSVKLTLDYQERFGAEGEDPGDVI